MLPSPARRQNKKVSWLLRSRISLCYAPGEMTAEEAFLKAQAEASLEILVNFGTPGQREISERDAHDAVLLYRCEPLAKYFISAGVPEKLENDMRERIGGLAGDWEQASLKRILRAGGEVDMDMAKLTEVAAAAALTARYETMKNRVAALIQRKRPRSAGSQDNAAYRSPIRRQRPGSTSKSAGSQGHAVKCSRPPMLRKRPGNASPSAGSQGHAAKCHGPPMLRKRPGSADPSAGSQGHAGECERPPIQRKR